MRACHSDRRQSARLNRSESFDAAHRSGQPLRTPVSHCRASAFVSKLCIPTRRAAWRLQFSLCRADLYDLEDSSTFAAHMLLLLSTFPAIFLST
jgi:hypothetical protein